MAETLKRPHVAALDAILGQQYPILDHGFVRVIDYMGDDSAIVQAARVSYGTGTKTVREDRGLIRYLLSHSHTTPFEMCELKIHAKMPIFVARQWVRHRTANINEYSARYSTLDKEFYVPAPDEVAVQSTTNRQGRGKRLVGDDATRVRELIKRRSEESYDDYQTLLNQDVARELARAVLPVNFYTQWYWKIDLHNLLHFLKLRTDSHAQAEIRAYADVIASIVSTWVPITWEAFDEFVRAPMRQKS